ncbi:MAG: ribonuclease H-like domain-containing protein [Gemmatimonadota bacterium]|nr:MAG: ribonuclease H-like domain-containing protein [Gemmatimonadota bacterium]
MPSFDEITRRWKERVERAREYEVVQEDGEASDVFLESRVSGREYEQAQALLRSLLKRYQNVRLADALPGEMISNPHGSCFHIEHIDQWPLFNFSSEQSMEILLSDLKLLYGIGYVTEESLRGEGFSTITHLKDHHVWGTAAQRFLGLLQSADTPKLQNWLWHWLPKSHPKALCLAGLHDVTDFLIFDIETMGLFGRPIILIGCAQPQGETLIVHQYLLQEVSEEPAALSEFCGHVTKRTALISYNGRSFDLPYIRERLGYYGQGGVTECAHFDMLHFARREWRGSFADCRLTTLEREVFGHIRKNDVPSALVPEFYDVYLKTGNIGPLVPIIQHNRQDVITLANIFSELCRRWGNGDW